MRRMLIWIVLAGCAAAAAGERTGPDPFKELDAKLAKSLERDKFSQASRDFVKVIWQEYKAAFQKNERPMNWHGFGRDATMPDIKSYDEYVGKYGRAGGAGARSLIEVTKDTAGRFFVELEGHTIPAIAVNRGILFTTGDVVHDSRLPRLGPKPHATLELYSLTRHKDRYLFTAPGAPPSRARPLDKLP